MAEQEGKPAGKLAFDHLMHQMSVGHLQEVLKPTATVQIDKQMTTGHLSDALGGHGSSGQGGNPQPQSGSGPQGSSPAPAQPGNEGAGKK